MKALNALHAGAYRALFGYLARRRPPHAKPIQLNGHSRVLLFTCAGIGDTLTDSVVFKALAETYPGIRLAGVVHHKRRALLEHNPHCAEVFSFRKGPLAFWKLHRALANAGPWDAILQLRGNDPEPRAHSFLLAPDVTVSTPNMTQLSHLCGHRVEQPDWDDTHGVEQTLRLARYLGADTRQPHLVYSVTPKERKAIEPRLEHLGVGPRPRLVLQIGGGRRASWRDWPVEHYAALAALISGQKGDAPLEPAPEIILLGGRDNLDRSEAIATLCQRDLVRVHDLTGKLSLLESAALLASARAVVSTDTGIMHLAFAVGVRVVALIHCNNPARRVGPYGYGDRHRVAQLPRPENYRTPADADMANLRPEAVYAQLQEIWAEPAAGKLPQITA